LEPQFELAQNVESKAGLSSAGGADIAENGENDGNAALPFGIARHS